MTFELEFGSTTLENCVSLFKFIRNFKIKMKAAIIFVAVVIYGSIRESVANDIQSKL